jgi:hypothetical protein
MRVGGDACVQRRTYGYVALLPASETSSEAHAGQRRRLLRRGR